MEYFESLKQGKYGSIELNNTVGPTLLRAFGLAVFVHLVLVGLMMSPSVYHKYFPEQKSNYRHGPMPDRFADQRFVRLARDPNGVKLISIDPRVWEKLRTSKTVVDCPNQDLPAPVEIPSERIPDADIYIPVDVSPQPLSDYCPQPAYPALALRAKVPGKVICRVYIDKYGNAKKCMVVSATPKGLGFEEEVLKVLPQWKFTPAMEQGQPVGVWISVPFKFQAKE